MSIDNTPSALYHAEKLHDLYREGYHYNERRARLDELREENPDAYYGVCASWEDPTRRAILGALVDLGGHALYADIDDYSNRAKRATRTHVRTLRQKGVLETSDGKPAVVSFRSDTIHLLARQTIRDLVRSD